MPRWRPPNFAGLVDGDILIKKDGTVWFGQRKVGYVGNLDMTGQYHHLTGRWHSTDLRFEVQVLPEPSGPDAVYSLAGEMLGWMEDGKLVRWEHDDHDAGAGPPVRPSRTD